MTRKNSQRRYNGKSRSLIARQILAPQHQLAGYIPLIKRQVALNMGIPVNSIEEIRLMKHQVWVRRIGADGRSCAQFFSYRRLPIPQVLVVQAVANCPTLERCHQMQTATNWEYKRFNYPVEMMDAIDEALEYSFERLLAAERL